MRNNPVRYTDPSGHAVACANDDNSTGCAGTGLGGLTPSQILATNASDDLKDKAIYNYAITHPNYNHASDPSLEDIGKFQVANAIFRGEADAIYRQPNIWDRLNSSWPLISHGLSLSVASLIVGGENGHTIRGKEAHRNYRYALGGRYDFEVQLPSGKRVDAIDTVNNIVRELKPDNPSAIARGMKQVNKYVQELQRITGQTWQGFVDTYRK